MAVCHAPGPECPSCEEKLKGAHPRMREVYRVVKAKFPDAHVSCAFRGEADQNREFAEGSSKLKWPKSKHNRTGANGNPCSQALDFFKLTPDGKALFPPLWYAEIADKCRADDIRWGGDWNRNGRTDDERFRDTPHFEMVTPVS